MGTVGIGALGQQQTCDVKVTGLDGYVQWGGAACTLAVDGGPLGQQKLGHSDEAA